MLSPLVVLFSKEGPEHPKNHVPLSVSVQKIFSRELCCNDEFFTNYLTALSRGNNFGSWRHMTY